MKIEHVAIWSRDIKRLRDFYITYFSAVSNELYTNKKTGFKSYFISFEEGARLEVMQMEGIFNKEDAKKQFIGYCHLAIQVSSKAEVIGLTQMIDHDGYEVVGQPRTTGDGYFESVVLDPDGNRLEITC